MSSASFRRHCSESFTSIACSSVKASEISKKRFTMNRKTNLNYCNIFSLQCRQKVRTVVSLTFQSRVPPWISAGWGRTKRSAKKQSTITSYSLATSKDWLHRVRCGSRNILCVVFATAIAKIVEITGFGTNKARTSTLPLNGSLL